MKAPKSDHLGFIPNLTTATFSQLLPLSKSQFPQMENIPFPSKAFCKDLLIEAKKAFGTVPGILQALYKC